MSDLLVLVLYGGGVKTETKTFLQIPRPVINKKSKKSSCSWENQIYYMSLRSIYTVNFHFSPVQ